MLFWQAALVGTVCAVTPADDTVLIDFYQDYCPPCTRMEPLVDRLKAMGYPVRKMKISDHPQLADRHDVRNAPTFVMLVDGRPVDRQEGPTSLHRLEAMCLLGRRRDLETPARKNTPIANPPEIPFLPAQFPSSGVDGRSTLASTMTLDDAFRRGLLAVTVRLFVPDDQGNSWGTGTIIDCREGDALILTCGHLFRESEGKTAVVVELLGTDTPIKLVGRVLGYSLSRDLALVTVKTPTPLPAARVAPVEVTPSPGDVVFSAGCDHGESPTIRTTRVNSLARSSNTKNIWTTGRSVEGRSGGGLFDRHGRVIGVSRAASVNSDEALSTDASTVRALLDQMDLAFVHHRSTETESVQPVQLAVDTPSPAPLTPLAPLAPLASREQELLDTVQRHQAAGDEVICIFRSSTDRNAPSEVHVLGNASQTLIDRLTSLKSAPRPSVAPAPRPPAPRPLVLGQSPGPGTSSWRAQWVSPSH